MEDMNIEETQRATPEADIEKAIADGRKAVDYVVATHETAVAAMRRDDVGEIDFIWGAAGTGKNFKSGYGLAHIIAKRDAENGRGLETAYKLVEVIAKGVLTERQEATGSTQPRLRIKHDKYTAVLSLASEKRNAWLLTGWENYDSKKRNIS